MTRFREILKTLRSPITIDWYEKEQQVIASHGNSVSLSTPVFMATTAPQDIFTIEDILRGIGILGGTGSGKTSGSGTALANAMLRNGLGGLVQCIKTDEADHWERLAEACGRKRDVIRITPDGLYRFNFLDYECSHQKNAVATNVAAYFLEVMGIVDRTSGQPNKDPFWSTSVFTMLKNAIVLDKCANDCITIDGITTVINTAPCASSGFRCAEDDAFTSLVKNARERSPSNVELEPAIKYFRGPFSVLADKTRSIIVAMFTAMADDLSRPPLHGLLCSDSTVTPDDAFNGKVIIVDLPVHAHKRVGRIANVIWKTSFKRACQRREKPELPVFLWADESQYIVDLSDVEFLTTARSSRCATVLLTQNIQNFVVELGSRDSTDALLGSLHTKIFHQNGDTKTNEYAANLIGKVKTVKRSVSKPSGNFLSHLLNGRGGGKKTESTSDEWDYDVPSRYFTNLRSGGHTHNYVIDGIIHSPGRRFSTGRTWVRAEFRQKSRDIS
jgi:hypothetical protein